MCDDEVLVIDEPVAQEEENDALVDIDDNQLEYVMVHRSQLEKLFQRCPQCGKLPREHSSSQNKVKRKRNRTTYSRTLKYSAWGTNVTVKYYCYSCNSKKPILWSSQPYIEGTRRYTRKLKSKMHCSRAFYLSKDHINTFQTYKHKKTQ